MPAAEVGRGLPRNLASALFHPWTWRMAWRDSRTQRKRLAIFAASIVSGIAALVAIHSLKASLEDGIRDQAKALLGSDLQISSRQPFAEEAVAQVAAQAKRVGRETAFASMLNFTSVNAARLVQVRAIEGGYPFYGKVETSPPTAWTLLQTQPGILLEAALLDQFGIKIGDSVRLGSLDLPVLGTVHKPAPRSSRFSGFAPEAYVRMNDLPATGLVGTSSLAFHLLHLEQPSAPAVRSLRESFRGHGWRFETPEDRQESLEDLLENFQQFLGVIALVALVLGAIGVAGAIHAHVSRRVPTVAILRCLGCPGNLAFSIYLAQAATLGLAGAFLGAILGSALHVGTILFFRNQLPFLVEAAPHWGVIAQTAGAGFAVCCGFALLPLLRVRNISPGATLREGATEERGRLRWLRVAPLYLLLAALLTLLGVLNSSSWERALGMTGGLLAAFLLLAGVAAALIRLARKIVRPSWPYLIRQGVSNLYRPHNQTLLFLLSLGLGTFLLLTTLLSRNLLLERINVTRASDSPNIYLVDVQPDQTAGVQELLRSARLPVLETCPMVTMRIQSVRGIPVRDLRKQEGVPRWVIQREFRSTYRDRLNATETLVAGEWKTALDPAGGPVPLSLEQGIARDLKVTVGDELELDVQGVTVKARVTSLRKVDWSRFNLNFFMVFPPGVLEGAPGFNVVTTRVPPGLSSGQLQRSLVEKFPNVSAIDLTLILETVRSVLDRIGRVIQVLSGFTLFAGLAILIGTLLNGRDQRLRESVLLRTLGASSGQVRTILIVEYATLGALSALSGVLLAVAANFAMAKFVFKMPPTLDPLALLATLVIATLLAVIAGLSLSRGVCSHPPLAILRRAS
ncbi:MAG TPA: FtsX-like permease family protein [Chthoniobacteraceae bacterium]|jgi:putative ABC transport system permease protein